MLAVLSSLIFYIQGGSDGVPGPRPQYSASTSPVTGGGRPGGGGLFRAGAPEARVHWAADPFHPTYDERL